MYLSEKRRGLVILPSLRVMNDLATSLGHRRKWNISMPRKSCILGIVSLLLSTGLLSAVAEQAKAAKSLRVMSYNAWVGGESGGQPLDQTVKVIQVARADLVGMQETHGEERDGKKLNAARAIADKLSWHYFDQGDDGCGIISRYPIVDHSSKKLGVAVELPSCRKVWLFNVHFAHAPYQPYQLLKIPYEDAPFVDTAKQAVLEARKARGHQVATLLKEVEAVRNEGTPILITGDFNEPSALDWTDAAWHAKCCPVTVRWPTTTAVLSACFIDAYRETHRDPLKWPGFTWTPTTGEDDPRDRHDRIDFVFVGGCGAKVEKSEVIGERTERADLFVVPYPSDHRGVVATVTFE
jgi:exodeoxyribonuclease III